MKAILILDEMPEGCVDCVCHGEESCHITGRRLCVEFWSNRPKYCPLIEIDEETEKLITERSIGKCNVTTH